ncbi:MAG: hypothetical protein U0Q55_22115 [Vicinamibacterales bacterium]
MSNLAGTPEVDSVTLSDDQVEIIRVEPSSVPRSEAAQMKIGSVEDVLPKRDLDVAAY